MSFIGEEGRKIGVLRVFISFTFISFLSFDPRSKIVDDWVEAIQVSLSLLYPHSAWHTPNTDHESC